MNILTKNRRLFVVLFFIVFLLLIQFFFSSLFSLPKIKSVFPADNAINISPKQTVTILFEKNINQDLLKVKIKPSTPINISFNKNQLVISPKNYFNSGTKYSLILSAVRNGKDYFQTSFTTVFPQGDSGSSLEAQKITKEEYPLAPFSPPDTARFYYTYAGPLKITVYLVGDQTVAKKEFLDFAKEKGVDLSTHQIQYLTPP